MCFWILQDHHHLCMRDMSGTKENGNIPPQGSLGIEDSDRSHLIDCQGGHTTLNTDHRPNKYPCHQIDQGPVHQIGQPVVHLTEVGQDLGTATDQNHHQDQGFATDQNRHQGQSFRMDQDHQRILSSGQDTGPLHLHPGHCTDQDHLHQSCHYHCLKSQGHS